MAFIDGQNLYQHAKEAFGHHHPNYDPIKLHSAVCAHHGWVPNLVRFYTGVPSHSESPMWAGYWAKRVLMMKRAGIHVTTRPIRYRKKDAYDANGQMQTISVPQEKGIDTKLVIDIVSTARKRQWDVAVLFSQDQDLCEVADEVKEIAREQSRRLEIYCAFPSGPNATTNRGVNHCQWFKMDRSFYDACLDPVDYRPSQV